MLNWLWKWRKPAGPPEDPAPHDVLDEGYLVLDPPPMHIKDAVRFSLDCPGCGEPFDEVRPDLSFACPDCGRIWIVRLTAVMIGPLDEEPDVTIIGGSMHIIGRD